jgi:hypothetical protein
MLQRLSLIEQNLDFNSIGMTLADAVVTAYDERAMLRKVGLSSAVVDAYWGK